MDAGKLFTVMGRDAGMAVQSLRSGQTWRGMKELGRLGRAWLGANEAHAGLAGKALGSAWRTMGFRGMRTGAMMGAIGGVGLQVGNNVMNGDSMFAGVGGAAMRGAFLGGAAGGLLGMSNWAGRRGSVMTSTRSMPIHTSPAPGARAWNYIEGGLNAPSHFSFQRNAVPIPLRRFNAARRGL